MLCCFVLMLVLGFSTSSPSINLLVDSQFKFQCLPESDLLYPEYSWSFTPELHEDQGVKFQISVLNHKAEELELSPVEHHHAGTYTCEVRGVSVKGTMKMKRTFRISVIVKPPFITAQLIEGTEGDTVTLLCTSSSQTADSFQSADVKWFKIKESENGFQELRPVVRSQSFIKDEEEESKHEKGTLARRLHWASDLKALVWSIRIDRLELDDASLYRCDVKTGSDEETLLMELVVNRAPPPLCLNHSQPWEACTDTNLRTREAILRESLAAFSLHFYQKVKTVEPERNLLFSPVSITMLLSHLLLGTRGRTRTELEHGLFLPSDFSCIHSEMKRLSNKTKDSILMANQMFFSRELKLQEAFINQSQEFYDSVPQKLTNDSEANVKLINTWVASKTQNRITELVDFFDESNEFILLNAVYFIGKWKGTFEVVDGEFTTYSGELLTVPTLYSPNFEVATSYIRELKAQVGKFTLTGKNSLYILLPFLETKKGLQDTEALLTEKNVRDMVNEMATVSPTASEVSLPKLKLLVNTNLLSLLKNLDLQGLSEDPNLCGMFDQTSAKPLTDARHRAFLSLTEKGVEAAATSSITFSRSLSNFNVIRPFVLMLWSEEINNPLFLGRVLHPQKSE